MGAENRHQNGVEVPVSGAYVIMSRLLVNVLFAKVRISAVVPVCAACGVVQSHHQTSQKYKLLGHGNRYLGVHLMAGCLSTKCISDTVCFETENLVIVVYFLLSMSLHWLCAGVLLYFCTCLIIVVCIVTYSVVDIS